MSPRELLARLANVFRKSHMETQLADELSAHIEEAERDYIESGMTPEEARLAARRNFGGFEQVKEHYRDQWGVPALETLWSDCRYGVRSLLRDRGFTAVAVCSLALGIGSSTAVFSLFQQVMLRSLSVQDPESLVYFYSVGPWQGLMSNDEPGGPSFSYPVFRELQTRQTSFVGIAGARNYTASLSYRDQASYERIRLVSGNYFGLLGVRPALGRLIEVDDERRDTDNAVVVLSYGYWESRFAGSPAVLNQTILVNNSPATVIGVAPKAFASEQAASSPQAYLPLSLKGIVDPFSPEMDRKHAWVTMVARLKPGTMLEEAEAAINVPYRAQVELDIDRLNAPSAELLAGYEARRITLTPGKYGRGGIRETSERPLMLMMATSLLVLLLACANVANLQLARGAARVPESVVRIAMGASRARLIRQFLVESWVLAICGGVLGLGVAHLLTGVLITSVPWWSGVSYLSSDLSATVLLFCFAMSSAAVLAFGLYPALKISAVSLSDSLKDQSGHLSLPGSAGAVRKVLVTVQIAITTLLLIASGLFGVTLLNLTRADLGLKTDHIATFGVSPRMNRYSDEHITDLHQRLTARLASIPGVNLVSSAEVAAIAGHTMQENVQVESATPEDGNASMHYNRVSEGYFATMGIPLVRGRDFTPADNEASPRVTVVNEAFVQKYFFGRDPVGASIQSEDSSLQIVGVVRDAVYARVREQPPPTFYTPLRQSARWNSLYFYLRTAVPPEDLLDEVREAAAAVDSTLPVRDVKTMEMQIDENTRAEQTISYLTAALAALATLLAVVGLYGVLAYNVARRRREFGIRLALGAQPGQIRRLVAREGLTLIFIGTLIGMAAASGVGRLIQSVLFGLEAWDGPVYLAALILVWAAALGATLIPARRASELNPLAALRHP